MIKSYHITVNGNDYDVEVEELGGGVAALPRTESVVQQPRIAAAPKPQPKSQAPVQGGSGNIVAPMPGTILDVKVSVGQSVKKGDVLVILEAMKMENEIMAPCDGKVSAVSVSKGASVSSGDALVALA